MTRNFGISLTVTAAVTLLVMTAYECLKQLVAPRITVWESHAITVVFSAAVATTVCFFVLRAYDRLQQRLAEKDADAEKTAWRLAAIVASSDDAIIGETLEGIVTSWNAGAERLYGYTAEEMVGYPITIISPSDRLTEVLGILDRIKHGESISPFETVRVRKDATQIAVSLTISPIKDASGAVVAASAIARDVTARQRRDATLRASEECFRALVEQNSDIFYLADAAAIINYVSPTVTSVMGYTPEQVLGKSGFVFIHPDDQAQMTERIGEVLQHPGLPVRAEFRMRRHDGAWRWMSATATNLLDAPGVRAILSTHRDVTERKDAESRLRERACVAALGAEIGAALTEQPTLPAMLHCCAHAIVTHLDAAFARIWTLNSADNVLELQASAGLYTHLDGPHGRVPVGELKIGLIAAERAPHLTNDVLNDPRVNNREWARQHGMIAFAGYPLIVDEQLVGVAALFARHELTEFTTRALGAIGQEIAVGIRRKHAEAALQQSDKGKRALLEVAKDTAGTLDLELLLDRVQHRAAELLPCDMVLTFAMDAETSVIQLLSAYGVPAHLLTPLHTLRFSDFEPFGGRLLRGETVVINDMAAQSWLSAELVTQFGITALIAAPVLKRDHYFGALVACNVSIQRFESHQVELLTGIARQLAVAKDAAEQYDLQKEEAEVSGALARVGREIVASLGTAAFLDRLCQVTAGVLECDASHALLWRAEDDAYVHVAGYGATPEQQEIARVIKVPRQMMSKVLVELEQADVCEVDTIPTDLLSSEQQQRLGSATNLCMALRRGTMLIGLQVAIARGSTKPFRSAHWRIARGIAQVASLALEHARVVEELTQANRLKAEFVAGMSHELRTPLNHILGFTSLLLESEFGPLNADQIDAVEQVDRSSQELFELVNATLDLGRLEAGRLPLVAHETALADLLSEVRAETQGATEKPSVTLACMIPPDVPPIHTDALKLKVILKNLVQNAMKFTEQGSVTVRAMLADDGVMFSVADTGIGIAPEVRPIIFEPFRQGDGSMTRHYGGVGLGLYIVRRFVDLLGGTVAVESKVGKGSTFRVWIPLHGAQGRVAA